MKKVIFNSNNSFVLYNFRKNLIMKYLNLGYTVYCISNFDSYSAKLKQMGCNLININMHEREISIFKDIILLKRYLNIFRHIKPDFIFNFTIKPILIGGFAAALKNIKCINNITGLGRIHNNKLKSFLVLKALKITKGRKSKFFFQNDEDKNLFINNKVCTQNDSVRIPGSGINLKEYQFSYKEKISVTRFLFIGRIMIEKGILDLLEAAKELTNSGLNFKLNIFGKFDESFEDQKKHFYKVIDDNKNINYYGFTDNVIEKIIESDCVVLPTYYNEGVPRSLIEAAAIGRPLITTNKRGCKDICYDNINGYIIEQKNTSDLLKSMKKIINLDKFDYSEMCRNGRIIVETNFDEKFVISAYNEITEEE